MTPADVAALLVAAGGRGGLVLDFDGTLAPIVEDPSSSQLPDDLPSVLERLATGLGVVAIVSGRPVSFLAERAAVTGIRLLGLYGIEEWRDGAAVPRPEAAQWQPALDEARDHLALALAGHPGILFEDKGLAVALHWRNAEDREAAGAFVSDVVAQVAADTGLAVQPGKFVAELRPPVAWDKGTAVQALVEELMLTAVVYVGDDDGDLPALAAARDAGGVAVVVDHGAETPPDVRAAGDVVLSGTAAVASWLAELAEGIAPDASG